jgi:hypothetical protein
MIRAVWEVTVPIILSKAREPRAAMDLLSAILPVEVSAKATSMALAISSTSEGARTM